MNNLFNQMMKDIPINLINKSEEKNMIGLSINIEKMNILGWDIQIDLKNDRIFISSNHSYIWDIQFKMIEIMKLGSFPESLYREDINNLMEKIISDRFIKDHLNPIPNDWEIESENLLSGDYSSIIEIDINKMKDKGWEINIEGGLIEIHSENIMNSLKNSIEIQLIDLDIEPGPHLNLFLYRILIDKIMKDILNKG